jgi:hypothetical protein
MELKDFVDLPPWDWPQDAGKKFKAVLTNKRASESDRIIAAELAGDFAVIDDDLSGVLVGIAGNAEEPAQLRARSAIALGAVLDYSNSNGFESPDEARISERTFNHLKVALRKLYLDSSAPKEVRRRVLEASVRAPEEWHRGVIQQAFESGDREWMLTAVFGMNYVRGFEKQILEALKNTDSEIQLEAVEAAGNWQIDGAFSHVAALVEDPRTPKPLLLEAMGAVAQIRPVESSDLLIPLTDSPDEEIAEAAEEALLEAGYTSHPFDEDNFEDEDELEEGGEWVN